MPNEEQEVLYIDMNELAEFVTQKTGIDLETVHKVLEAEADYYVEKGIAEMVPEQEQE